MEIRQINAIASIYFDFFKPSFAIFRRSSIVTAKVSEGFNSNTTSSKKNKTCRFEFSIDFFLHIVPREGSLKKCVFQK